MEPTAIHSGAPPHGVPANGTAVQAGLPQTGPAAAAPQPTPRRIPKPLWRQTLEVLASLRLTVVLFALSLILVFYGTIIQKEIGTWAAVEHYFRCFYVQIPLETVLVHVNYLPRLFNPDIKEPLFEISGWVPFPGGWLLGTLLMVNLLAAHIVRFRFSWDRAGVLVLHAGLVLLMIGEVITGLYQVEGIMSIKVGESANYIEHRDTPELALTRVVDPTTDEVIAYRGEHLQTGAVIDDERLPFTVEVLDFMPNHTLEDAKPGEANQADAGHGRTAVAESRPRNRTGIDEEMDFPAAYVRLTDRATSKARTYLLSPILDFQFGTQHVEAGGRDYELAVRFKRAYRPYTFTLDDFEFKKHPGTEKARDFRSHIHLVDPSRHEDRKVQIYMNHPLRYQGETFYQYQASVNGQQGTVLQVVKNPAWTLPYIACCIVAGGMLIHFGLNLFRFLERRAAA